MDTHSTCPTCHRTLPVEARFCSGCGGRVERASGDVSCEAVRAKEILNLRILYIMVGVLILAVLFPPWESAPGTPPAYLGMHFILNPPEHGAVVSGIVQTVELATLAIGGMYLAWAFRDRP